MENLIPQVISWAEERNIINGSNLESETLKLVFKCGELTQFLEEEKVCNKTIGHCMIQMIIICRMRNTTLDECLNLTKTIKDVRVADPKIATIRVFKTLGKLAQNIFTKKDIKSEIGYLLIYLTALTNSLQLSMRDCIEDSFNEILSYHGIMFNGKFLEEADEGYDAAKAIIDSRKSSLPQ